MPDSGANTDQLVKARQLLTEGMLEPALDILNHHLLAAPADTDALDLLAFLLSEANRTDTSDKIRALADAIRATIASGNLPFDDKSMVTTLFEAGYALTDVRQFALAEKMLEKCLEIAPDEPVIRYELAFVLMSLNRFKDAIPHFEKSAAELRDFDTNLNLAVCHTLNRDLKAARQSFEKLNVLASSAEERKELVHRKVVLKRLEEAGGRQELNARDWLYTLYGSVLLRPQRNALRRKDAENKASDATNKNADTASRSTDAANKSSDTANKSSDTANKSSDTANKSSDTANKSSDAANKSSDTANKSSDTANKSSDTANKSSDTANKSSDAANKSSDTVNRSIDTASRSTEVSNKNQDAIDKNQVAESEVAESESAEVKTPDARKPQPGQQGLDLSRITQTGQTPDDRKLVALTMLLLRGVLEGLRLDIEIIEYYNPAAKPLARILAELMELQADSYKGPDRPERALLMMAWAADITGPHQAFIETSERRTIFAYGLPPHQPLPLTPEVVALIADEFTMPWSDETRKGSVDDEITAIVDIARRLDSEPEVLKQIQDAVEYYHLKRDYLMLGNHEAFPERPEYTAEIPGQTDALS